jgi:hypothetical protein
MIERRHRLARSLSEPVKAVLLAMLIAGCGSSGAPKPASGPGASGHASGTKGWKPAVPDTAGPIVAVVGGRKVTRHEIDSLITTAPTSLQPQLREPEGYRQVIERTVTQEAIYQAAIRDSVAYDPAYQGELARVTRDLMMKHYYQAALASLPSISDSVALAYYESHQEQFTISARARLRHILLATQSQAKTVRRSLVVAQIDLGGLAGVTGGRGTLLGARQGNFHRLPGRSRQEGNPGRGDSHRAPWKDWLF